MLDNMLGSRHQRWITARHEAGHAVAALHYDCPFESISIERIEDSLGADPQGTNAVFFGSDSVAMWTVGGA